MLLESGVWDGTRGDQTINREMGRSYVKIAMLSVVSKIGNKVEMKSSTTDP